MGVVNCTTMDNPQEVVDPMFSVLTLALCGFLQYDCLWLGFHCFFFAGDYRSASRSDLSSYLRSPALSVMRE